MSSGPLPSTALNPAGAGCLEPALKIVPDYVCTADTHPLCLKLILRVGARTYSIYCIEMI